MTTTILFDFWGTLAENGVYSPLKQAKEILQLDMPFSQYVVRMEKALMLRRFEDLNEAFAEVLAEFGIGHDENLIAELVGLWNKNWMTATLYDETLEVLQQLREEYKLVLVSNTDCFSINNVLDKFELRELFDHAYLSYEVGLLKSESRFFNKIARDLHLDKSDMVMVGDSIQSDIMGAKSANVRAILIDRRDKRVFPEKILTLSELRGML